MFYLLWTADWHSCLLVGCTPWPPWPPLVFLLQGDFWRTDNQGFRGSERPARRKVRVVEMVGMVIMMVLMSTSGAVVMMMKICPFVLNTFAVNLFLALWEEVCQSL